MSVFLSKLENSPAKYFERDCKMTSMMKNAINSGGIRRVF